MMGFFTNGLVKNITIGGNVRYKNESMANAFRSCSNFNSPITIPNSVTNMAYTFYYCLGFNQPVTIPNSVTNMAYTFRNCINLNQPIAIPNGVTNMSQAFYGCNNFNQSFTIPNGVTDLYYAFYECKNLIITSFRIPNSVTNMAGAFRATKFMGSSWISNSVTNLAFAFMNCNLMSGDIVIYSKEVTNIYNFLAGKNNSRRINIYVYNNSNTYKRFMDANNSNSRFVGNNMSWTYSGGNYFNSRYNVYLYKLS